MSSSHLTALPAGYQLQDYLIEQVLGQGTFGITYKAQDTHSKEMVAIKEYFPREFSARDKGSTVLASGSRDDVDSFRWGLEKFVDEAKTLTRFDHPNLIAVRRFFQSNGTAYLVMDYCDGEPLDVILDRERTLDYERIVGFLRPLLAGLEAVHATDVVHRDIKPGNIFIKADGQPVLLDFGAARQELGSHSRSVTSLATPGYAALEQYATRGKLGPWTDIYGLAATIYRCVTGVKPQGALDRQLEDELEPAAKIAQGKYPDQFLKAIDWALKLKLDQRPPSVTAWRAALFPSAPKAVAPRPAQGSGDPSTRNVLVLILAVVFGGILLLLLFIAAISSTSEEEPLGVEETAPPAFAEEQNPRQAEDRAREEERAQQALVEEQHRRQAEERAREEEKAQQAQQALAEELKRKQAEEKRRSESVFVANPHQLPACPANQDAEYHNCWGTQTMGGGQKYTGEFQHNRPNGWGTRTFPNVGKYVGEEKDGLKHGQGIFSYENGTRDEGIWEKDKFKTPTKVTYPVPISRREPAPEPVPAKTSVTNFSYGDGTYTGEVVEGKPNGKGEYRWNNGTVDKGEFVNGALNGQGTRTFGGSNMRYTGRFKDNKCFGEGVRIFPRDDGYPADKFEANFTDCDNGVGNYTFGNGGVSRFRLVNGQWLE